MGKNGTFRNGYGLGPDAAITPVTIAGAGVAGLAAAVRLAERGTSVQVLETARRIGSPAGPHTEGLRNYGRGDVLKDLRDHGLPVQPFGTAHTTIRRSRHHTNVLRGPAYYLIARGGEDGCLDRQLFDRARKAGASLRLGASANVDEVDIVAAGRPSGRTSLYSVGYTFSRRGSPMDDGTLYALLDNDIAPRGYFAMAPGPAAHSLYTVAWTDLDPASLRRRVAAAEELPWVRELLGTSRRVGEIEGGAYYAEDPIAEAVAPGGALRVGEAAGFQDAIAGYGVRYALLTGAIAAESLLDGQDYRACLREEFGTEFQEAYAFRKQLSNATNEDMDRLVASMGPELSLDEYKRHRASRAL